MSDAGAHSVPRATVPVPVWDGAALLAAIDEATTWLDANRDAVNALNVFPVPDGDTGTNMSLTMRAAAEEGRAALTGDASDAGEIAAKVAFGSLMGARGNSGVILSQIFRGFARAIDGRAEIDGRDVARGLSSAREMAYNAVMKPVEGTMLTVIRGAAERAERVATRTPALTTVLAEAVAGAREALATTPDLLDILRQAGVVDAGGQGVVYILEGMEAFGRGVRLAPEEATPPRVLGAEMAFLDKVDELHGDDAFGYCTNFVVFGSGIDFPRARDEIAAMGRSAVIVGDESVVKVHIHADDPGVVLSYAAALGSLDQIKVDNMQAQTRTLGQQREQSRAREERTPANGRPPVESVDGTLSVLAVAAGEGIADALRSLGASGIVAGGQTMNPSIEELLSAVEADGNDDVILLPNNPNIVLTANQVPALTGKQVAVVPSRSIPQGLAALATFNVDASLAANVERMTAALETVRTIELTRAVRDAEIDGVRVAKGQIIGLLDDRLVAAGEDPNAVACQTLEEAGLDSAELVTVFTGEGARPEQATDLREAILALAPEVTVEIVDGGQPHYRFVIAVE